MGGYVHLFDDGIVIHISNKKAILIMYKNLFSYRKSIKPIKDYHIKVFESVLEIGAKDLFRSFNLAFLLGFINNSVGQIINVKKGHVKILNNFNIVEENRFNAYIKIGIMLNNFMLLASLIKIMIGKLINGRKKQNKYCN